MQRLPVTSVAATIIRCGGSEQSPINIVTSSAPQRPGAQSRLELAFNDYAPAAFNDGRTVKWEAGPSEAGHIVFEGNKHKVPNFRFHVGSDTICAMTTQAITLQAPTM